MARRHKPLEQKRLEGRKYLPEEIPQAPATGQIPDFLPEQGKAFLIEHGDRIRKEIGVKASDEPMLFMIAATYGYAVAACEEIQAGGLVIGDEDTRRKNPAEAVFRAEAALFVQMATKFGLSPVDRQRLMQPEKKAAAEDSVLDGAWKDPAERRRVQ